MEPLSRFRRELLRSTKGELAGDGRVSSPTKGVADLFEPILWLPKGGQPLTTAVRPATGRVTSPFSPCSRRLSPVESNDGGMTLGKAPLLFAATLLLAGARSSAARAAGPGPDKMECIAADTEGQSLRRAGKLVQARKRLAVCAAATCPSIVREDCQDRIVEIAVAQPTVVFTATNGEGRPLVAVRVLVDGVVVAGELDGRALAVDPGEHLFAFEALGRITTRMRLTLQEGEKKIRHAVVLRTGSGDPADEVPAPEPLPAADLVVSADLPASAPPAAPSTAPRVPSAPVPEAAASPAGPAPEDASSSRRIAAITAGAVGVLGLVVGSVFGLLTIVNWDDASQCLKGVDGCSPSAVSEGKTASTDGNVSTVAFVAGGIALTAGAWLWFAPPGPSKRHGSISILPAAGPSQGQFLIRGRF
jgi:hypothetical protein